MTDIHCPMIHGGLQIDLKKHSEQVLINHCCLRTNDLRLVTSDLWQSKTLIPLRETNSQNKWDYGCWPCCGNEDAGLASLRTGMLEKFGKHTNLSGPQRLDLMFDIGCNLACRTCGPHLSTYWQQHLKQHKIKYSAPRPESRVDDMIEILKTLDLSNLEMVVFCGGETLLGQGYWRVAEAIADLAPHAKDKITISFQTNGTQPILERNYKIIERFHLVKLNISLDGIREKFEYLRWPAKWDQVSNNILNLKATLPTNVLFLIEETLSIFNLYYYKELEQWVMDNFATNRLGDIINHTRHTAFGIFNLSNITQEYVDTMRKTDINNLIRTNWIEKPTEIQSMINEIARFDKTRDQNWTKTFPEVAEFYKRYDTSGM